MQERNMNHANKLTPNNPTGKEERGPRLGRLGRRPVENSQSMSELQAKIEMQKEQETEPDKAAEQPAPSVSDNRNRNAFLRQSSKTPADPELKGGATR